MLCRDTKGELPAIHLPEEMIQLAQALAGPVEDIQHRGGNGTLILQVSGGTISGVEIDIKEKRRFPIPIKFWKK